MTTKNLGFDIHIPNFGIIELTENYEGDKYHIAVFNMENDYIETVGLNTEIEVFNFLRLKQSEVLK